MEVCRKEKQEMKLLWAVAIWTLVGVLYVFQSIKAEVGRPFLLVDVKKRCSVYKVENTTVRACPNASTKARSR